MLYSLRLWPLYRQTYIPRTEHLLTGHALLDITLRQLRFMPYVGLLPPIGMVASPVTRCHADTDGHMTCFHGDTALTRHGSVCRARSGLGFSAQAGPSSRRTIPVILRRPARRRLAPAGPSTMASRRISCARLHSSYVYAFSPKPCSFVFFMPSCADRPSPAWSGQEPRALCSPPPHHFHDLCAAAQLCATFYTHAAPPALQRYSKTDQPRDSTRSACTAAHRTTTGPTPRMPFLTPQHADNALFLHHLPDADLVDDVPS